jgi:branched-chain amino acid transport system substrate-binding protein
MMALVAGAALSACGGKPVIGILLPMSGSAASYGVSMKKGIELALDDARTARTMPAGTQLVWGDSGTDPEQAVTEFRRLVGEGNAKLVILGTTSDEAKVIVPLLEETNTLALTPSASAPGLTKESKLFFRLFTSDELEGRRAARFLREDQDNQSTLIYAVDSEQARGIEPPFRQVFEQAMDGTVVGRISLSNPDWRLESADLLAADNPESVYIIGLANDSIEVVKHLREKEFEGTICLTSAFYSGEVVDRNLEILEGIYFPQPAFDMQDERDLVQDFVSAFRTKNGHDPDIYAAHAYDAMRLALHAIKEAKIYDTSELRKAFLFSIGEFPGVTGIISFNDYGDVHHNPIMFTVRDGKVVNYERYVKEQKKLIRDRIRRLLRRG